ncbi:MAG: hypothetical protein ACREKH_09800, partial [Candidatus Rokuibacteriota bacterium]
GVERTAAGGKSNVITFASAGIVDVSAIPLGPGDCTARELYMSAAGDAGPWKLATTVANNVDATAQINVADGSLGAEAPSASSYPTNLIELSLGGDTSGGNVAAGSLFKFTGESTWFQVASLVGGSTTRFQLAAVYTGSKALETALPYVVTRDFSVFQSLILLAGGDAEFRDAFTRVITQLDPVVSSLHRKAAVTGVAPSATAGQYGPSTEIGPTSGHRFLGALVYVALTSAGTFGSETLTVRLTATYSDDTTGFVEKTFTATGQETALTGSELFALLVEGLALKRLSVAAKSSIGSSAATAGAKVGALNS